LDTERATPENDAGQPAPPVEWIRNAKNGDPGSYRKIYDLYARKVLNFLYRMVASREEAEDLTQETFLTVYSKLSSLKDDAKFEPWLFRIARNYAYQRYRSRLPATLSLDAEDADGNKLRQLVDEGKTPDEAFQAEELERVVNRAIGSLPDKYREVFILSALQQLSYQQVSEVVGRSLGSVKTDIHRARLHVRRLVKDYLRACLDGEMELRRSAEMSEHLHQCGACAAEHREMRGARDFVLSHIRSLEPGPEIWNNLRARMASAPAPARGAASLRWWPVKPPPAAWAGIAASAALALGIWGYWAHRESERALELYMRQYIELRDSQSDSREDEFSFRPAQNPFANLHSVSLENPFRTDER